MISEFGCFETTSVTFSKPVITFGESVDFSITIKNTSGKKISKLYVDASIQYPARHNYISTVTSDSPGYVVLYGKDGGEDNDYAMIKSAITWNNGTTKTFSGTYTLTAPDSSCLLDYSLYPMNQSSECHMDVHLETDITTSTEWGAKWDNFYATDASGSSILGKYPNEKLSILPRKDAISIVGSTLRCDANGVQDDEGERILTTLSATAANETYAKNHGYTITCTPSTTVSGFGHSLTLAKLFGGFNKNKDVFSGVFDNELEYDILIKATNKYESYEGTVNVEASFSNVHLSGKKNGGVRFGGFSTADDDTPKFECNYPTYLYGNIAQIGGDANDSNVWTPLTPVNGKTPATYGGGVLRCRKIENKCIITGSVEVKPSSSTLALATLPAGFVPKTNVFSLNACSGGRVARVAAYSNEEINAVDTRGKLVLTWVRDISDGSDYTSAAIWIQCSIEYWTD